MLRKLITPALCALSLVGFTTQATIVEFQTSHGDFKVNLHDETTPITVENFLKYVTEGRYDNTIVHRTVDDFVIQGGGAKFEGTLPPTWIDADPSITNEPIYSNVTATISMAKGANINSATSQWFINTKNNASSLDPYNRGGFTAFGEVIEDGMTVVNAIAEVERCNTGYQGFTELPMPDYTEQCADTSAVPGEENFVTIYSVTIFDSTVSTDGSLASVKNTLYSEPVTGEPDSGSGSGGGSMAWYSLFLIGLISTFRRKK
ncbi:MAG: peptidylprolyl isomerase [Thalassotalea sp.]|nr:peptidylprolyl isomerase [Thalassotalea sp.]